MSLFTLLAEIKNSEVPGIPKVAVNDAQLGNILSAVFMLAGIVAVFFIIIGGIRYTMSRGDASQVKKSKETILYALVGLIVTTIAFGIVRLVVWVIQYQ